MGETLAQCAVRETMEETGVALRAAPPPPRRLFSSTLEWPSPVAAADSLTFDAQARLAFHYAIVNLAARPLDPHAQPVPADDADGARWVRVGELRGMGETLVEFCDEVAEEAVRRYKLTS